MEVGFVGLGRLGLPVSVAMTQRGHTVYGYDVDERKMDMYRQGIPATGSDEPNLREKLMDAITDGLYLCDSLGEVLSHNPEIVFVAVPTPSLSHGSFDTSYVESAVGNLHKEACKLGSLPIVAVISTVLPTTMRRIAHKTNPSKLCYNPSFIGMGAVIEDFLNPEFVLIGQHNLDSDSIIKMRTFYLNTVKNDAQILFMSWENAG